MRVVLHGFGTFSVVFFHLIKTIQKIRPEIEWAIVLTTNHHAEIFYDLLGKRNVLILSEYMSTGEEAISGSHDIYPGNLFLDIEAEKRNFKYVSSEVQYKKAMSMYAAVKRFFIDFKPSHALVSQVEGYDGKLFIAASREAGCEVVVPTLCRNLGGVFYSSDDFETLPLYTDADDKESLLLADDFIARFRNKPLPAAFVSSSLEYEVVLDCFTKSFPERVWSNVLGWFDGSRKLELDRLRVAILNNVPLMRDAIWHLRKHVNQKYFDIKELSDLPDNFIYFPIQYSPESSINTPAAYYLDQMRAIDAIRYSMPSNYTLVVKEHPACVMLRSSSFVKKLMKTAGVKVAECNINGLEIVKRADLTISVTGTSTLEALVLGKPSINLGSSLVSSLNGGVCAIDSLRARINDQIGKEVPYDDVRRSIASLFSVRYKFTFSCVGTPGEPVLRQRNIDVFASSFLEHCERVRLCHL